MYVVNTCTVTGARRLLRSPGHPPHRPREPGRLSGRDRLLRADRPARRSPRSPGWTWSWATRRSTGCPSCSARSPSGRGREVRGGRHRRTRARCPIAPVAPVAGRSRGLREDPGRLPAPLRLLHRAGRARAEPEPGAQGRRSTRCGPWSSRRLPRRHAHRGGHRPLRLGSATRARALAALLRRARGGATGLRWLRLSSVLPSYFTPELFDAVTTLPVMAPHLHLPLQSGSDRVLRRMRRPYHTRPCTGRWWSGWPPRFPSWASAPTSSWDIRARPRRTSRRRCASSRRCRSRTLHVFAYSDRKGTEAARRPDHVAPAVIRERSGRLRRLGRPEEPGLPPRAGRPPARGAGARRRAIGAPGSLAGLTDNYVEVLFEGPDTLGRRVVPLTITEARADRTHGVLEEIGA